MQLDMFLVGQRPGPGAYECHTCSEILNLADYEDELTPCPYCKTVQFILIDEESDFDGVKSDLFVNEPENIPAHRFANENFD